MGTEETKEPNGQGKQVSYGKDVKGREMRTAETILNIIQDRGMIGQSLGNKETREPCAVKMARTVRRGTGGKGLMDLARSLPYTCTCDHTPSCTPMTAP